MAMRLSESPVADDELRSEALGGRDLHDGLTLNFPGFWGGTL